MSTPPPTPADPVLAATPAGGWRPVRIGEWRLLALILLLFLLRDMPWRLEEFDQAKQAFTSLEMVQAGHWWFQHFPGNQLVPGNELVATKPPLVAWISAGFYYLTLGNWDLAWRLPSLLAAVALLTLLWRAGEHLWPRWGGTVAAGAFALNFLTPRLAMLVRTDMPLTLEITLLGLIIWNRLRTGRPWTAAIRWAVFWLLLATLMTKGPIVYAFLLPGLLAHHWISRRRGSQQPHPDAWGGWWHWTLPLLPFLFWLERGCIVVPGFYEQVVGHEFMGRFSVGESAVHHNQPVYFYVLQLLTRWAPWSVLLLTVRLRARRVWWQVCRDPATLWLVCWAAGGLLCLSLVPSKRVDRIFPVIPPLCLLLTAALAAARRPADPAPQQPAAEILWPQQWSRWTLWLACALAVGTTVEQVSAVYRRHDNVWTEFGAQVRSATGSARRELVLTKGPMATDESMLVYLRRLAYLDPAQAIQLNSTGSLDYIVVNAQSLDNSRGLLTRFNSARPLLVSPQGGKYVLLSSGASR